jgi:hypothetical protein
MTIIGKILTILTFLMSLVFLGFAFTINQLNHDPKTGKSWHTVAEDLKKHHEHFIKDIDAKHKMIAERDGVIANLRKEVEETKVNADRAIRQARDQAEAHRAEAAEAKQKFEKHQAAADNITVELEKRRQENVAMQEVIRKKDLALADSQAALTKMTNEKIAAQVALSTAQDRVRTLEKQTQDLTRSLEEQQQRATETTTASASRGADLVRRPPPDDVRGQVKSVTADGLVSITIGSDAGLLKGHTLEVFRTEPKAQYLGVIQIVDVGPHEAVGKLLTPQFKKLVQPNDIVASRILPSR